MLALARNLMRRHKLAGVLITAKPAGKNVVCLVSDERTCQSAVAEETLRRSQRRRAAAAGSSAGQQDTTALGPTLDPGAVACGKGTLGQMHYK